jgi:ABC-type lipoprotein release transport system permease subunit
MATSRVWRSRQDDDLDLGRVAEQGGDALADQVVVLGQHDPDRHGRQADSFWPRGTPWDGGWPPSIGGGGRLGATSWVGFNEGVVAILYRLRCGLRCGSTTYAGLVVVVAITFAVVVALVAGAVRTLSAPDRYSASRDGRFGASVEQISGQPRTSELERLDAVDQVQAATFVFGAVVPQGAGLDETADALVFAGSQASFGTTVVEGREPDPAAPDEFAATRSFVWATGASLGDRFDLWVIPQGPADTSGFDAADHAVRLLRGTLVGVVDGPAELQDGYPLVAFPAGVLDLGDVGVAATHSVVSLEPGSTIDDLRAQLDELPDASQFGIERGDWVPDEVRSAVRTYGQGLAVLAGIAAVATIVVVGQLLGRQVRLAENERGVLRSMGMSRGQLVADPLARAAVPTVVGAVAAVGLAYAVSGLFPTDFVRHVEPDPGRRFEILALLPGALAIVVLVLAWVVVAILASGRQPPAAGQGPVVDALARRAPPRVATALRFAFTRQARDPTRPRAAVVGAAAVVAVLVGAVTFGASLAGLVDRPSRWGPTFDLTLGQGGDPLSEDVRSALEDDPDVAAASLFGTVLTTVGAEGFDVTGVLPVLGSTAPHVFEGRLADGADEIAIGRVAARRLGVGVGDDLPVVGPAGPRMLTITGLAVIPAVEGGDGVGEGGLVTLDGLLRIDPSAGPTAAGMRLRPEASLDAVRQRLSEATGMTVGPGFDRPGVIINVARVRAVPYLVAAVLGVLVLLNLAHHLILSLQRRRRDIAILQALGANSRWVTGVVHWQASLFTLLVLAVGTPVGIMAGRLVYRAFVGRIGAVDTVTVPIGLVAVALVVLVLLANVVAAPGAQRARQRPPSGVLAEE